MNRKQKIIVSVIAILIVTLALVGLTYAYFLTRINGNTNTKSIEVTTADFKLEYNDGNPEVITANNITPNTVIGSRTFTFTNTGETYVNYSGMCWRIVRIEGDGNIKLILASPNGTCQTKGIITNNSTFIGAGRYIDIINSSSTNQTKLYKFLMGESLIHMTLIVMIFKIIITQ